MILLKFVGIIILFFVIFFLVTILSVVFRFWGFFHQLSGKGQQQQNNQGWYNPNQQNGSQGTSGNTNQSSSSRQTVSGSPKPRNSEIDKNEGEYVDFEEIP